MVVKIDWSNTNRKKYSNKIELISHGWNEKIYYIFTETYKIAKTDGIYGICNCELFTNSVKNGDNFACEHLWCCLTLKNSSLNERKIKQNITLQGGLDKRRKNIIDGLIDIGLNEDEIKNNPILCKYSKYNKLNSEEVEELINEIRKYIKDENSLFYDDNFLSMFLTKYLL